MLLDRLRQLFGANVTSSTRDWAHISVQEWPSAIYAIGDIHGCISELRRLEEIIFADAIMADGEKWMVYLGDYIDRGPSSAGVIDHLTTSPPKGFRRICLAGNHEAMALDFVRAPHRNSDWLGFGGLETLQSYGIAASDVQRASSKELGALIRSHIPDDHVRFMENLVLSASVPGYIFVHAGLRPGVPIAEQDEHDLLWIREEFLRAPPAPDLCVVHGHTPGPQVILSPGRIAVDTGAFATGILSAVRLHRSGTPTVLATTNEQSRTA